MKQSCPRHQENTSGPSPTGSRSPRASPASPSSCTCCSTASQRRFPELTAAVPSATPRSPTGACSSSSPRACARRARAGTAVPAPEELLADLRVAEQSLREQNASFVAEDALRDVIRQVEVFGFHFALLDVRENSDVHRGRSTRSSRCSASRRTTHSCPSASEPRSSAREIADRRPLIPRDISGFSPATREAVETFRTLHDLLRGEHPGTIDSYVISNTTCPADLLEVLLLMKEAGLARAGGQDAQLRIVPLFESGETLEHSAETIRTLLRTPVYRAALDAVGEQEVMVGYWTPTRTSATPHRAGTSTARSWRWRDVFREHGVQWQFFHGRGGAVGRGGGPSYTAVRAQPQGTVAGRLKVTEQGEMLSAKFSLPEIAHRELELTTSAALVSDARSQRDDQPERQERFEAVAAEMAEVSTAAYRELVYGDADFADFFHAATPVREVSRLQLGSRPAKRRASARIEDFRAIPWVFSWTQARAVLPAWFGLGTALEAAREQHGVDLLREMERDWPYFAALISNAAMACVKADLDIARRYAELCSDDEIRERIWGAIETEFRRTVLEIGAVRDEEQLLDREPILQRALARRNPFIDPLSFVQLELLRRLRAPGGDPDDPDLVRASLLAINGIAGGLRNTG